MGVETNWDVQRLLLTEKEYFRGIERYDEHGEENEPGFLCIVDVGTGDVFFEPTEEEDEDGS